ncbi:50S ribosomal protein L20 [Candidatus Dependentiae bacterium]|nr:50S ribosomal protein L20 [Candidatus Dependentiae bacterium]
MSRVKRGVVTHRRHKKLFKQTKGFWGQRSNVYKRAHETLMRALRFAYIGRRLKKRDFRKLFITRINAAARIHSLSYSVFTNLLKKSNVAINRKMLSQLAIFEPDAFGSLVKLVKK